MLLLLCQYNTGTNGNTSNNGTRGSRGKRNSPCSYIG